MTERFTRRLCNSCGLNEIDAAALRRVLRLRPTVAAGREIRAGDGGMVVMISGLAFRGTMAVNGARAVTGILLPGDICGMGDLFHIATRQEMTAITDCEVAVLPGPSLMTMCLDRPAIMQALLASAALEHAILREWIVATARLDATHRTARLFCELHARYSAVEDTPPASFALPLTQALLADILGLSAVHMNRSLKWLKQEGLVAFGDGMVTIPDMGRLRRYADFDASYLHAASPQPSDAYRASDLPTLREKRFLN